MDVDKLIVWKGLSDHQRRNLRLLRLSEWEMILLDRWSFDLITEPRSRWRNRSHHESGEPIEEPIHPGQQRRIRQGQEVFSEDCFSSVHIFFARISLFCYNWFRLQLIAIHCDWRCMWTEHAHTAYFLAHLHTFHPWRIVNGVDKYVTESDANQERRGHSFGETHC